MTRAAAIGLAIMAVSQAATFAGIEPFSSWNTPIAWTGFILFADAVVYAARGRSWLRSSPREFAFLAILSVPLWVLFEGFNLFIRNWHYVGLPENPALRYFGYTWSFATIWPAIFLGGELIAVWRARRGGPEPRARLDLFRYSRVFMAAGAAMLLWPVLFPSPYLAAPVWLGFIFLLDPVNARAGRESLMRDLAQGRYDRLINLTGGGLLCGGLWEFWNYWATAKWHYTVPIMENLKIFEMPVPGYLGFPAFALECFAMYVFVRALAARVSGARFTHPIAV